MTEPTSHVSRKRRVLAVLLSFIPGPGAGHLLLGRWKRGLLWLALLCAVQATMLVTWMVGPVLTLLITPAAAVDAARTHPAERLPRPGTSALWVLLFWLGSLVPLMVVRGFVVEPFHVPSQSMEPTLLQGDHFMLNHTAGAPWGWRGVERGDIAVFERPEEPDKRYVKRVVALAGDTIALEHGQLVLNSGRVERTLAGVCGTHPFSEPHDSGCTVYEEALGAHRYRVADEEAFSYDFPGHDAGCPPGMEPQGSGCEVPAGTVFVRGDNRDNSMDSRQWGPVPVDAVLGVASHIHFSWSGAGVRWERLGQRVR